MFAFDIISLPNAKSQRFLNPSSQRVFFSIFSFNRLVVFAFAFGNKIQVGVKF